MRICENRKRNIKYLHGRSYVHITEGADCKMFISPLIKKLTKKEEYKMF
jgi:hypothetical protein